MEQHDGEQFTCSLRRWALITPASFQQPYWWLTDVIAARRMLRARLDCTSVEDTTRQRTSNRRGARIARRCLRRCYLCEPIDGTPEVYFPETLHHTLLFCPAFDVERTTLREKLAQLAWREDAQEITSRAAAITPVFSQNDQGHTTLLMVMLLAMGLGPAADCTATEELPARPAGQCHTLEANKWWAEMQRASPQFNMDMAVARATTRWTAALMTDWTDRLRNSQLVGEAHTSPGHILATLVASHLRQHFHHRRRLLNQVPEFVSPVEVKNNATGVKKLHKKRTVDKKATHIETTVATKPLRGDLLVVAPLTVRGDDNASARMATWTNDKYVTPTRVKTYTTRARVASTPQGQLVGAPTLENIGHQCALGKRTRIDEQMELEPAHDRVGMERLACLKTTARAATSAPVRIAHHFGLIRLETVDAIAPIANLPGVPLMGSPTLPPRANESGVQGLGASLQPIQAVARSLVVL